jgi:membrane protein implicated in regulation of membrane protease activity
MRTVVRYALFQLPSLCLFALVLFLVRLWIAIPLWLVILLIVFWAAKDAVLYPVQRPAFSPGESGNSGMIGRRGWVTERIDPEGYVELEGARWRARGREGSASMEAGSVVEVKELDGLTLVVEPVEGKDGKADSSSG